MITLGHNRPTLDLYADFRACAKLSDQLTRYNNKSGAFSFESLDTVDARHLKSCLSERGYTFEGSVAPSTNFGTR